MSVVQTTQIKIDFFNTSTVASVANHIINVNALTVKKSMITLRGDFQKMALSGNIINRFDGFRVRISAPFAYSVQGSIFDLFMNNFYTYRATTNVQMRVYPHWATDTTNYLVCKLENPVELSEIYDGTILSQRQVELNFIEQSIRTSIPTWLYG
jgi:hypothetical protein